MNPKYWGTTQLTIDAGYNFPFWSTKLLDGSDIGKCEEYKIGMSYRWVDDELATLIWNRYGLIKGSKLWTLFFLRFLNPKIRTNMYLFSDPRPFIGLLTKMALRIFDDKKKKIALLLKTKNV